MKSTFHCLQSIFAMLILVNVPVQATNCTRCETAMTQGVNGLACINCNPEAFGAGVATGSRTNPRGPTEHDDSSEDCIAGEVSNHNPLTLSGFSSLSGASYEQLLTLLTPEQQQYFEQLLWAGVPRKDIRQEILAHLDNDDDPPAGPSGSGGSTDRPPRLVRSEDRFLDVEDFVDHERLNDLVNRALNDFSASRVESTEVARRYEKHNDIQAVLCKKIKNKKAAKKSATKFIHLGSFNPYEEALGSSAAVDYVLGAITMNWCAFIVRSEGEVVMSGLLVFESESQRVLLSWNNVSMELEFSNVMPFLSRLTEDISLSPDISIQIKQIDFYVYSPANKDLPNPSE